METSATKASQLKHILTKMLPAPEMVAQGKAFRISNHLEMIRNSLWTINSIIFDGTYRKFQQPDVAEWMKDVNVAIEDVDSLLKRILDYWEPSEEDEADKKKKKMNNFFHPFININNIVQSRSSRPAILVELKEMACLLNYLVKRGTAFGLWVEMMDSMDPSHDDYSAIINEEVIGREEDEEQIIDFLQQQQCDEDGNVPFIIAIDGDEYSGKTTLARKMYHHPWVCQYFQHRIWLNAPYFIDFNINMIAKEIARLLTGKSCMNIDCWPLINEHLGGDRYLLILDDVYLVDILKYKWEELKLNLLHCGAPGSKVILTRHSSHEYGKEIIVKKYKLNKLPEDALVRILLRYATFVNSIEDNNNIHKEKTPPTPIDILMPLAKKCSQDARSLIIVKTMGLMFRRRNRSQWQELANQMYDNRRPLYESFFHMYSQYWLIEDTRIFFYMSLFEGSSYESCDEDVYNMLVAEGTLTIRRFMKLRSGLPSELDTDPCFFRMKVGEGSRIPPQCRHLNLPVDSKNISISKKAIEKATVADKLRTLVLHREEKKEHICPIETKILNGMLLNLTRLCTLHMRGIMIQDFPSSVGTLHCLRYLNLAENKIETLSESLCNLSNLCVLILSLCKKLKELPRQIHKLRKLQILKLSYCQKIQKLPESITHLVNLKELDVGGCCWLSKLPDDLSSMKNLMQLKMHGCASLTIMPGGIRQLPNLQVLWGYDAMDDLGNDMLSGLQDLKNLESLHIQHLEKLISAESEEKDITPPTILQENQHVNELMLHWEWWNDMTAKAISEPTVQLIEGFKRNIRELEVLRIVSYMSVKLPSWLMREGSISVLNNLTTVHLVNLRRCERLPSLGHLPQLEEVTISGFDSVRVIDDDFYGKDDPIFPWLERLIFSEMPRLEKWDPLPYLKKNQEEFSKQSFRQLQELTLIQCPKLREFYVQFPSYNHVSLKLWLSNELLMPTVKFTDWENLWGIRTLQIFGSQELRSLSDGLREIPFLQELAIINCNKLEALPIWLVRKLSLESLCVYGCPMLSIIPEGLKVKGRLRNLIVEACPKLQSQKYLTDKWDYFR